MTSSGRFNANVTIGASFAGENMRYSKPVIYALVLLLTTMVVSACSGSDGSSGGVAQIDTSQVIQPSIKSAGPSDPKSDKNAQQASTEGTSRTGELTDEQITTNFADCLRDHGLNVPDPELNADGSVNLGALKQGIDFAPKGSPSSKALDECLPLLEGATFSQGTKKEDEVQLQDELLAFSQCLRDEGIDAPDPDFSGDPRAGMGAVKESLKGASGRVERSMELCNEKVFGASKSAK